MYFSKECVDKCHTIHKSIFPVIIDSIFPGIFKNCAENHLEQVQQLALMEMIEDRHGKSSAIIASQLPIANWYDVIGEETIADAIMARIVHTSYRIELKGDILRKKR